MSLMHGRQNWWPQGSSAWLWPSSQQITHSVGESAGSLIFKLRMNSERESKSLVASDPGIKFQKV
jgi:hypothetical protein